MQFEAHDLHELRGKEWIDKIFQKIRLWIKTQSTLVDLAITYKMGTETEKKN